MTTYNFTYTNEYEWNKMFIQDWARPTEVKQWSDSMSAESEDEVRKMFKLTHGKNWHIVKIQPVAE